MQQDAYGQQYQIAEAPAAISYVPVVSVGGSQYEAVVPQYLPVTYTSLPSAGAQEGGGSVSGLRLMSRASFANFR